jgi:osmoprotectant transport system ATP-binding protein
LAHPANEFVENFLGFDRGIKRLSFFPASTLALRCPATVQTTSPKADIKAAAAAAGTDWVLALDWNRRPVGWLDAGALDSEVEGPVNLGSLRSVGHTFMPATDSLRAALDALVLSPSGLAVAVDATGSLVGVASDGDLNRAIHRAVDGS